MLKKIIFIVVLSVLLAPFVYGFTVDHSAVREFDEIPDYWLGEAKKLTVHYGHTSHGSQILSGLIFLNKAWYSQIFNITVEDAEICVQIVFSQEAGIGMLDCADMNEDCIIGIIDIQGIINNAVDYLCWGQ